MFYCGVNTTASFHPLPKVRNTQLSCCFSRVFSIFHINAQAGYRLESVLMTVQGDSAASSPHPGTGETEIE